MSFVEHSAFRRLAYYLGSSDFFSRHDDNNFSQADNKRYLRSVTSLRGHLRVLQREPKVDAGAFDRIVALMDSIHELMPRLLKQTGTEAGLECLAALEYHVTDLGKAVSEGAGTLRAAPRKISGGAVLPSWESFAGQREEASHGAGGEQRSAAPPAASAGQSRAPNPPVAGGGLTAASFMDSDAFAAQAEQRRAEAAAAKARQSNTAPVAATPESAGKNAGESPCPAMAAEKSTGTEKRAEADASAPGPEHISPATLVSCTEYFTDSAALHGRAAKIWGLLACAGAAVFCYFFYHASLDVQIAARSAAGAGYEGFFFVDLLATKTFVFLPWFCVILLCIRSCRIEREHQARILRRRMSLSLYATLGSGLDLRGRSKILGGIIAPETTARR